MKTLLPKIMFLQFFILFSYSLCFALPQIKSTQNNELLNKAADFSLINADSSAFLYKMAYKNGIHEKDTSSMIKSLLGLANMSAHKADFGAAYDSYWEALLLSDQMGDEISKIQVYYGLGWLYSLYARIQTSEIYFNKSLNGLKTYGDTIPNYDKMTGENYYALGVLFRKAGQTGKSKAYLDSCRMLRVGTADADMTGYFVNAELGYNQYMEGNYDEALSTLLPMHNYFKTKQHSYLVIYDYMLGQIFMEKNEAEDAERYLKSAIAVANQHKSHYDITPEIYERLAELYRKMGKSDLAYKMLKNAKQLNESIFGGRSEQNQQFLEIKDLYRLQKEEQAQLMQEQRLIQLENEDSIWYLKSVISYITIIFLVMGIFTTYRYFRIKYNNEKRILEEKRSVEEAKTNEIIEIKNKELTSSALQIIQHEETLAELKKELEAQRKAPDKNKINKLAKSINTNTAQNWKEFEARFVKVNGEFYKKLRNSFPELTQGEQKICALIKLNFNSKEMAKLLGISTESVHTTRYRLRKKLHLQRSDNLGEFIDKL